MQLGLHLPDTVQGHQQLNLPKRNKQSKTSLQLPNTGPEHLPLGEDFQPPALATRTTLSSSSSDAKVT